LNAADRWITQEFVATVLRKLLIKNYRIFKDFQLELSSGVNIIVGDNDTGKSTLLEAINLALTGRLHGFPAASELSPYLFNQEMTEQYVQDLRSGSKPVPPEIVIEVYLDDVDENDVLRGANNLNDEDCLGVRLKIVFDDAFSEEYQSYIAEPEKVKLVPTEYYRVEWLGFSGNPIRNARKIPDASLIDASAIRLQTGADYYLQQIIANHLDPGERVELSRSYRSLREAFAGLDAISDINAKLADGHGGISSSRLSMSIDISQRATWERSLVPHVDDLPFQFVGSGEQNSLKIMLALNRKVEDRHIILVEEPENHLSFSSLNTLMEKITKKCDSRQVLVTTHSSYVLNKLGLGNLILLGLSQGLRITGMQPDTVDYFKKLPGYDTLRLVLAKRVILVEGPSDELVVQRAYLDAYGRLPIEDGIDVISVRGLQARRFLDVAVPLGKPVVVVNDNDGDMVAIRAKYADYDRHRFVRICVGDGAEKTLEPQIVAANGRVVINKVLGTSYATDAALLAHMKNNKTSCALAIFESPDPIRMPEYIRDAITR
jgi:energy-coupling factor transporter ATP-binding protein EcfA2